MPPEIGRSYTGPLGHTYTVLDIVSIHAHEERSGEWKPGEMKWVVIRRDEGCGTIRFPIWDAAKWLREPD